MCAGLGTTTYVLWLMKCLHIVYAVPICMFLNYFAFNWVWCMTDMWDLTYAHLCWFRLCMQIVTSKHKCTHSMIYATYDCVHAQCYAFIVYTGATEYHVHGACAQGSISNDPHMYLKSMHRLSYYIIFDTMQCINCVRAATVSSACADTCVARI